MPRDIRNVERGACIEGCRSCPNFLSVEPGRILCDYCGCPPTKHEILQSHSLISPEQTTCKFKLSSSKENDRITELKNDGLGFPASRTSSNDSGCYISSSSLGSSSTSTSASTSSCSPYISEEEVEGIDDDCFISGRENELTNELSATIIPQELKKDLLEQETNEDGSSGVYNCSSTAMVVKIRTKKDECLEHHYHSIHSRGIIWNKNSHHPTISTPIHECKGPLSNEEIQNLESSCINSTLKSCKRKARKAPVIEVDDGCKEKNKSLVSTTNTKIKERGTVEENSTLQGIGQLEIGDEQNILVDLAKVEENIGENKIIRSEGDFDVSDHTRKSMMPIQNERRSEQV